MKITFFDSVPLISVCIIWVSLTGSQKDKGRECLHSTPVVDFNKTMVLTFK